MPTWPPPRRGCCINGVGAIGGPIVTGWLMARIGTNGFFLYLALLNLALAGYAGWRMTRRPPLTPAETGAFAVISPTATTLAVEAALEAAQDIPPARD